METKRQQHRDTKAERLLNKAEEAKSTIAVTRNADGTHTARCGKETHTTRRVDWDAILL